MTAKVRATHGDRLWPVLTVLVVLVVGAIALEVFADQRDPAPLRIAIHGSDSALDGDEGEPEAAGDYAPESRGAIDELHDSARTAARRGEIDRALALFEQVVAAHPESARVRDDRGYWLMVAGQPERALEELIEARALAPRDALVAANLGAVYRRLGRREDAEREYRRALELEPQLTRARVALSTIELSRGRHDAAIALLEPATRAGSNDERARAGVALGAALLAAGRIPDAERALEHAIARAPADASLRVLAAAAWRDHGGDAGADRSVAVLEQAVAIAPDVPRVHGALARARERVGDEEGAADAYRRALALDPAYLYARRRLLRLAMERRDFEQARAHADRLLADDPSEPEHHFLAALVASRDERVDDARGLYRAAIDRSDEGRYPEAYFNLGILERAQGHLDAAIDAYERAIEQRPRYLAAINNLGIALAAGGRDEEAEATYRHAIALDEHYAPAWVNLGELLSRHGRHDDAVAALRRAVEERGGDHPRTELDLGRILEEAARLDEAMATYRGIADRHPRQIEAWVHLARALRASGSSDRAATALERAREIDAAHVEATRLLAEIETERGRSTQAIALYADLLDRVPTDRAARLAMAALRLGAGDRASCERELGVVLAGAPDDPDALALARRCGRGSL